MSLKDRAEKLITNFITTEPLLAPLYNVFGGLAEFYCFWMFAAICFFEWHGKLEGSFAAAITAICGIAAIRDVLDDHFKDKQAQRDTVNVTVNQGQ